MVIAELTLAAQPDEVWRHLREPALISRWFGWDYEGLGHEIDVIFLQEARVDDRAHVLEWGDGIAGGATASRSRTSGSRRACGSPGARRPSGYDDIAEGWITFAHQLRFAIERGGREARRTLHLTARRRRVRVRPRSRRTCPARRGTATEHQTGIVSRTACWRSGRSRRPARRR